MILDDGQSLQECTLVVLRPRIACRHTRPNFADLLHGRQIHGQELTDSFVRFWRARSLLLEGARLAREEHLEHPPPRLLVLSRWVGLDNILQYSGYQDPPAPIHIVPQVEKPTRIEELSDVIRKDHNLSALLTFPFQFLDDVVVVRDSLFDAEGILGAVLHHSAQILDARKLALHVALLLLYLNRHLVLLKLVKTSLDHIIRVCPLHAQQIEQHVVTQMERTGNLGGRPQEHVLRNLWLHLRVKHDDGQATIVLTSTTSSPTHLDVLAGE
mmetsp:Transcript_61193/g.162641  ORF Transcript_61193/g.162641 Transcript_61193/m.162641 type:complete len:270 (-) Transcript_61193:1506-2315(-)